MCMEYERYHGRMLALSSCCANSVVNHQSDVVYALCTVHCALCLGDTNIMCDFIARLLCMWTLTVLMHIITRQKRKKNVGDSVIEDAIWFEMRVLSKCMICSTTGMYLLQN